MPKGSRPKQTENGSFDLKYHWEATFSCGKVYDLAKVLKELNHPLDVGKQGCGIQILQQVVVHVTCDINALTLQKCWNTQGALESQNDGLPQQNAESVDMRGKWDVQLGILYVY